nr:tetratricopeptide repeat protein [Roseibium hamelinense]
MQAQYNKGMAYFDAEDYAKAEKVFTKLAKHLKNSAEIRTLLGVTNKHLGNHAKAKTYFLKASQLEPQNVANNLLLAENMVLVGDPPLDIINVVDRILDRDPKRLDALLLKLSQLCRSGKTDEAFELAMTEANASSPDLKLLFNFAVIFQNKRLYDHSITVFNRLIELVPDCSDYHVQRARVRGLADDLKTSTEEVDAALKTFPGNPDLLLKQSDNLMRQSRNVEALELINEYLAAVPFDQMGHLIKGNLFLALGQYDDALVSLAEAERHFDKISKKEDVKEQTAKLNMIRSEVEFGLGNLETAWELNNGRFGFDTSAIWRDYSPPIWSGEDLSGKDLLVWQDQGLGDTIRSATLFPELIKSAKSITLEVDERFVAYFAKSFPHIKCRAWGDTQENNAQQGAAGESFDFSCNITDIARHLRPNLQSFDEAVPTPFAFEREKSLTFLSKIENPENKPIIGVCWRSNNMSVYRARYYLTADEAVEILDAHDAIYVNLQTKYTQSEKDLLAQKSQRPFLTFDDVDLYDDLWSTASLIAACDVVVSANTSIAEQAGALGVPCVRFGNGSTPVTFGKDYVPWSPCVSFIKIDERYPAAHMVSEITKQMRSKIAETFPQTRKERLFGS